MGRLIALRDDVRKRVFRLLSKGLILLQEGMTQIPSTSGYCLLHNAEGNFSSCVTLLQCLNNFRRWTGASIPVALQAVTSRPAAVLGLSDRKGTLRAVPMPTLLF
jgi:N-acetylglucosamine-6-phosphate deacetylase